MTGHGCQEKRAKIATITTNVRQAEIALAEITLRKKTRRCSFDSTYESSPPADVVSRRNYPVDRDGTLRRAASGTGGFDTEAQGCHTCTSDR